MDRLTRHDHGAMPVATAARALGVSESTLRRKIRDGCPVARRGGRGRGKRTLIDPDAVRAWEASSGGGDADAALRELAGRIPEALGDAMFAAFRAAPDKRNGAWIAAYGWQLAVYSLYDEIAAALGEDLPTPAVPETIDRLTKIAK